MKPTNDLNKAKQDKNDEFYTLRSDIDRELRHYKQHFKDKIVYCNCDDPKISNFYQYFSDNFKVLGLKKLVTTCYKNQDPDLFSTNRDERAIKLQCERGETHDGAYFPQPPTIELLKGDGDFNSHECIDILKQADIIVTNPPFSKWREYFEQLIQYEKKFLIIGNGNAASYVEVFRLIRENKVWLGTKTMSGGMYFDIPSSEKEDLDLKNLPKGFKYKDGNIMRISPAVWYTNLDHNKRHQEIVLYKSYNETDYPKYDNYDAISVNEVRHIPLDYDGAMGVPISFFDKYNPDQFEICGADYEFVRSAGRFYVDGRRLYARIVIQRKRQR